MSVYGRQVIGAVMDRNTGQVCNKLVMDTTCPKCKVIESSVSVEE